MTAVYSTANLGAMVGQAPHGQNIAFHPVLNLGVVNHHGLELTLFNGRSLVKRKTIPVSAKEERSPRLLTFGGRGTRVILWNGNDVANEQGLYLIPLGLTEGERAALKAAF